jgi:Tetratricopeptide repeat
MWLAVLAIVATVPPGYAADAACGECHADRAQSYSHVAMSRSFYRPHPANLIEDFDAPPFFHEKSKQYFEMRRRGDGLVFRRWQLTADGAPVHVYEQIVDWILGSGNHARTYLYRTPGGELYQLPVNWYSQTRQWAMAPGYDRADHEGVTRRVRHECMFCHNAYAAIPPEPLSYWRSQTFPAELPEGIGCQRCHGPGLAHVNVAKAKAPANEIRASIVNPSRLPARARNDVCYQCHMQPVVALQGIRRFGRDIYSFRPGQLLSDYSAPIDVVERDLPRSERFEINHHPYRLEQSRCFTESEGQLSCLTCHDPHRKVAEAGRAAHYRKACMSCHAAPHHIERDCTSCHMQPRRTQDVVHVVMTDHFIRRTPGGAELLAKREEREPSIDDVVTSETGRVAQLYRILPVLRALGGSNAETVLRMEAMLGETKPAEIEPYLDLAMGQLRQRRYAQLEQTAKLILERSPDQPLALEWLGLARAALARRSGAAIPFLEQATRGAPRPESDFNLGVFLAQNGRVPEAIERYKRALAARPNLVAAWIRLGEAQLECGDRHGAAESFAQALSIDPRNARAQHYLNVATGL